MNGGLQVFKSIKCEQPKDVGRTQQKDILHTIIINNVS